MDGVREMNDRLVLPQPTGMRVVDERREIDEKEEKAQERKHLPLPESFPQPLKAGGIKSQDVR